jgi:hypothetical protein
MRPHRVCAPEAAEGGEYFFTRWEYLVLFRGRRRSFKGKFFPFTRSRYRDEKKV